MPIVVLFNQGHSTDVAKASLLLALLRGACHEVTSRVLLCVDAALGTGHPVLFLGLLNELLVTLVLLFILLACEFMVVEAVAGCAGYLGAMVASEKLEALRNDLSVLALVALEINFISCRFHPDLSQNELVILLQILVA